MEWIRDSREEDEALAAINSILVGSIQRASVKRRVPRDRAVLFRRRTDNRYGGDCIRAHSLTTLSSNRRVRQLACNFSLLFSSTFSYTVSLHLSRLLRPFMI